MINNRSRPLSLRQLKRLGNKQMADAQQAVANAKRLAHDVVEVCAETQRLHNRFHAAEEYAETSSSAFKA